MHRDEFRDAMAPLLLVVQETTAPETMEAYFVALQDLPVESLQAGVVRWLRESPDRWLPSPGKLRELAGAVIAPGIRADSAWSVVVKAISQHGAYRSVEFSDPVVNAVIASMGGWVWLCEQKTADLKWIRKDFEKQYAALAQTGIAADQASPLAGISDADNARDGHATARPVRIECGLPAHRPGIVHQPAGGRPAAAAMPAPEAKRLSHDLSISPGDLVSSESD